MRAIEKFWNWFSGKKTVIGYIGVQFLSLAWAQSHISTDALEIMRWGFGIMGGIGVMHKVSKSEMNKNFLYNLKNKKK
jgi:hypothetical protein